MHPVSRIHQTLEPLRHALLNHRVYERIDSLTALQVFMEHHVFAVWDFMSLLKRLQQRLCSVTVPWLPAADAQACRLINEIVLAEESDTGHDGEFVSHFELYRRSMRECGANTAAVDLLLTRLQKGSSLAAALAGPGIPGAARRFVEHTFAILDADDLTAVASAFTFGREGLLPGLFQRIVEQLNARSEGRLRTFRYYLERHIGLDGDEHGPMATRLVESLCGCSDERWQTAEQAAVSSLTARLELWNAIDAAIQAAAATDTAATGTATGTCAAG